jgi:hypothetical protein
MPDPYKDQKGFGKALGKTLKLIAWCLHDWFEKHNTEAMDAIAFDKLVELVCRYWDSLRGDGAVSFGTPFEQRFGIHGPGRALRQNPKPSPDISEEESNHPFMYSGKVIEVFNGLLHGEHQLFKIEDTGITREFSPGFTSAQIAFWESDPRFLNRDELGVFAGLRSALSTLSADQIRALGTHTSPSDNERTLMKIAERWKNEMEIALKLQSTGSIDLKLISNHTLISVRNARELVRKSSENQLTYSRARRSFLSGLRGTKSEKHAIAQQEESTIIWGASGMQTWRSAARLAFRLSKYIYAISLRALELQGSLLNKNQKRDLEEGERCRRRLQAQLNDQTLKMMPMPSGNQPTTNLAGLPQIETIAQATLTGHGIDWLVRLRSHLCRDCPVLLDHPHGCDK